MFTGSMGRISVFCSYAREDEIIRHELEMHLAPLRAEKLIDDWYDSRIQPGTCWNSAIQSALERTRLILFIVTPHLLASRYVAEVEIPKGIELERSGQCRVVPIMAREAAWGESPLSRFQALPNGGLWISQHVRQDAAFREIAAGIRVICKDIVDWENPYKRSQVGDWTHVEHSMTVDGETVTAEGTEELISKTDDAATLRMEIALEGDVKQQTVTIDLTRPLEAHVGDIFRQMGTELPSNFEMWWGPAQYGDDVLNLGGRRYETVRSQRDTSLAQRGLKIRGSVMQWRSIDVPLNGLVKAEGDLHDVPFEDEVHDLSQRVVLLDFGHGDAATRKPRLQAGTTRPVSRSAPQTLPATLFTPGRWHVQMNAFGMQAQFDLLMHPNGFLQGQQYVVQMVVPIEGRWVFDADSGVLTLEIMVMQLGMPVSQDLLQMHVNGGSTALLEAQDATGRQFLLQRVAGFDESLK